MGDEDRYGGSPYDMNERALDAGVDLTVQLIEYIKGSRKLFQTLSHALETISEIASEQGTDLNLSERGCEITIENHTPFRLGQYTERRIPGGSAHHESGFYDVVPPMSIEPWKRESFNVKSQGFPISAQGYKKYQLGNSDSNLSLEVGWNNPFVGSNSFYGKIVATFQDRPAPYGMADRIKVTQVGDGSGDIARVGFLMTYEYSREEKEILERRKYADQQAAKDGFLKQGPVDIPID